MTTFLLIALLLSVLFIIITASLLEDKPRIKMYDWDSFEDYDVIKEANNILGG